MKEMVVMHIDSFDNGKLTLSVDDKSVSTLIKGIVDYCKEKYSSYIKLEMSAPYKKRTLPENRKYWAMCTEFGNYCGSSKEEVSLGVKWRAIDEGLWETVGVPFSDHCQPKSTSQSDTKEMSVLIDVLYRIAAESGYVFKTV